MLGEGGGLTTALLFKKTEASINPREGIVKREVTITVIALVFLLALPRPTAAQDVADWQAVAKCEPLNLEMVRLRERIGVPN